MSKALSVYPEFQPTGEKVGMKSRVYQYVAHWHEDPAAAAQSVKAKAKTAKKGLNSVRMHGAAAGR